jgi:hypothetical protein
MKDTRRLERIVCMVVEWLIQWWGHWEESVLGVSEYRGFGQSSLRKDARRLQRVV